MPPIRRYLRITKYSVLECRIYLDNPALAHSWLLNPRDPVLPRVMESIRPLVLPKLLEERERAGKKGAKNKGSIRDVLVEDDFEVALFLTETETRHSLLLKHRIARDKTQTRLVSNSTRLTAAARDTPIDVDEAGGRHDNNDNVASGRHDNDNVASGRHDNNDNEATTTAAPDATPPVLLHESDDDDAPDLARIPAIGSRSRSKRRRSQQEEPIQVSDSEDGGDGSSGEDDDHGSLFGDHDGDAGSDNSATPDAPPAKKQRSSPPAESDPRNDKEAKKKKLMMDVSYEGFALYGRVLCLVVKRRSQTGGISASTAASASKPTASSTTSTVASRARKGADNVAATAGTGAAIMENWIASTQMMPSMGDEEDEDEAEGD